MRSLGDLLAGSRPAPTRARRYRSEARFIRDLTACSTPMNRDQRARVIAVAEGIERRTKAKGARNGLLGQVGLQVLRCLLFRFQNKSTGLCFPSYRQIMDATGLCRQSIAKSLRALEAAGIVKISRRLIRREVDRGGVVVLTTVQATSVYAFSCTTCVPITPIVGKARSFPKRNALFSLVFEQSLQNRGNNHINRFSIGKSWPQPEQKMCELNSR